MGRASCGGSWNAWLARSHRSRGPDQALAGRRCGCLGVVFREGPVAAGRSGARGPIPGGSWAMRGVVGCLRPAYPAPPAPGNASRIPLACVRTKVPARAPRGRCRRGARSGVQGPAPARRTGRSRGGKIRAGPAGARRAVKVAARSGRWLRGPIGPAGDGPGNFVDRFEPAGRELGADAAGAGPAGPRSRRPAKGPIPGWPAGRGRVLRRRGTGAPGFDAAAVCGS